MKSADVVKYYAQLVEQVELLNQLRVSKRDEQNRVDTVLDDCFRLISLFFLTIGRNREAPAIYSCVATVKRLLDHLKEAAFYLPADLRSISDHLDKWQQTIERGKNEHSEHLLTLLQARIDLCKVTLMELKAPLKNLDEKDMRTYEKLVSILRSLSACNARTKVRSEGTFKQGYSSDALKYPRDEVKELSQQLDAIQSELHAEGVSHEGKTAEEVYAERLAAISLCEGVEQDGPTVVKSLLARCLLWVEVIETKYAVYTFPRSSCTTLLISNPPGKARSTNASRTSLANCSKSRTPSNT